MSQSIVRHCECGRSDCNFSLKVTKSHTVPGHVDVILGAMGETWMESVSFPRFMKALDDDGLVRNADLVYVYEVTFGGYMAPFILLSKQTRDELATEIAEWFSAELLEGFGTEKETSHGQDCQTQ